MKVERVVLVFVLLVCAVARKDVNDEDKGTRIWSPIEDINDPHVTEIAKFAVTEYDKESSKNVELGKVLKGDTMEVSSGKYYRLTLNATDGSSTMANTYETVVWEKSLLLLHFKTLVSFNPVQA